MQTGDDRRPPPGQAGRSLDVIDVVMLVAIAALLIARVPTISVRFFDPDELEHAHAAWSVWRGLLPYRDFFEHHTPWYYFGLAPFFGWFAVDQSFNGAMRFLAFGRAFSLALCALSAALVFLIGRRLAGRRVGLLAALSFVAQPIVIQKTLEIRPDVPALAFFVGGLWLLLRGLTGAEQASARRLGWFLGGGLCLGASIMCTQKMLFVLPGALTGLGLWALAGGRRALLARSVAVLAVLVGAAVPFLATWLAFAVRGGGTQFIYENFTMNSHWKLRSKRNVLLVLRNSAPMVVMAAVGATVALKRFFRAPPRRYDELLLLCTLGGLLAGVAIVPAAYRQYYLAPLAIACLFAAQGLLFVVELARERLRHRLIVGATVLLVIWPAIEIGIACVDRDERQIARLRYVFEHTRPADTVLDGWLGAGVFRPHPLYYGFMHLELLAMLSDADVNAHLDALESGPRPALIALDDELRALGPRFLRFVHDHYVSADGVFYAPRAPGRP